MTQPFLFSRLSTPNHRPRSSSRSTEWSCCSVEPAWACSSWPTLDISRKNRIPQSGIIKFQSVQLWTCTFKLLTCIDNLTFEQHIFNFFLLLNVVFSIFKKIDISSHWQETLKRLRGPAKPDTDPEAVNENLEDLEYGGPRLGPELPIW